MKKGMSLRFRITFITSLLLILVSVAFTLSGIYNLSTNVIEPLEIIIDVDMEDLDMNGDDLGPLDIRTSVKVFSKFSFLFMLVLIFLGTGIMYILSGLALKPAKKLVENINKINEDCLSSRIEEFNAGDELNSIANSFNSLLERLELAFEREKRFSSAAAHELKTPITVIKTNLEVFDLNSEDKYEEVDHIINIVNKQIDRMAILVDDLMILSSSKDLDKNEVISLNKVIDEIIIELSDEINLNNIKVELDLIPSNIIGNTVMMKHAISNIILNAIKYSDNYGKIKISIVDSDDKYSISIKDEGTGIDECELEFIFEPFYRVEKSRSRKFGGSGLGLPIARDIVVNHGGDIVYKKNGSKGSEFIIVVKKAFIE